MATFGVFCRQPIQSQNSGQKGLIFVDKMDGGLNSHTNCRQKRACASFCRRIAGRDFYVAWVTPRALRAARVDGGQADGQDGGQAGGREGGAGVGLRAGE